MTDPILDKLKAYFENTPREQVEKDWAKLSKWGEVGQPINEFLNENIMNKLELKHIVGYLPYGLKFELNLKDVQVNYKNEIRHFTMTCSNVDLCLTHGGKPILRPLSDLTKEIDGVVHLVNIADLYLNPRKHMLQDNKAISKYGYLEFEISTNRFFERDGCSELFQPTYSFDMINYLFQHHFDIYGLIEQNLAININTL